MLNISVQLCGLVLVILLFYFSVTAEKGVLESAKMYIRIQLATMCCISFDVISIVAIYYLGNTAPFITKAVCKLYLISILWVGYFTFSYVVNDIPTLRSTRIPRLVFIMISIIASVAVCVTPLEYVCNVYEVYSYGLSVNITYGVTSLFVITIVAFVIMFRNLMNPHRVQGILIFMGLTVLAAGIQLINRNLLLIGYCMAIGVMIIFAKMENPETDIDKDTGLMNFSLCSDYVRQLYLNHTAFSAIMLYINFDKEEGREQQIQAMADVARYLRTNFKKAEIFRGSSMDFVIVFKYLNDAEEAKEVIAQRFRFPWSMGEILNETIFYAPDCSLVSSLNECIDIYEYSRTNSDLSKHQIIMLDREVYDKVIAFRKMQNEIVKALDEDRVEVFFQPIYSVKDGKFRSAEALARIRGRDGRIIMPGQFIPIAEKTGLVEDIGDRVFEKCCYAIKNDSLLALGIHYIEVNLSVIQCEKSDLAERYSNTIKEIGIEPKTINLEITESSAISNRGALISNMSHLKDFGCSFSLDDFGTGESNLNYIVNMPVDIVKFDYSMTQDYFRNDKAKIMMRSVVQMIGDLKLKIVAEGVEKKEQLEEFAKLGIDYIQGYYFSRPLPKDEFLEFLRERNSA